MEKIAGLREFLLSIKRCLNCDMSQAQEAKLLSQLQSVGLNIDLFNRVSSRSKRIRKIYKKNSLDYPIGINVAKTDFYERPDGKLAMISLARGHLNKPEHIELIIEIVQETLKLQEVIENFLDSE